MANNCPTSPSLKTSSFYSSKPSKSSKAWLEKQAKWETKCEEFKKKPIPKPRLLRLDDPIPVFQHFPLQQLAFEFAKSCSKDVHIFSEEIESDGKRRYLVSTVDQFWQFYRKLEPEHKHFYEVITEGSACKLYFDLEFKKEFNQDSNGEEMLDIWIKYVCSHIKQHFAINCDRKHIIDLDSSTDSKFSRHLIFGLPGAVFKDNIHVGNFVNHICGSLLNLVHNCDAEDDENRISENQITEGPSPKIPKMSEKCFSDVSVQELKKLLVKNSKGEIGTFCDQGVYTKNRNFRLFKSTKYGKNSTLELAKENLFKPDVRNRTGSFSRDQKYLLFLDSLICNVSHSDSNNHDVKILTFECDTSKHGKRTRSQGTVSSSQDLTPSGYEHSPYPQIDEFITSVIDKGGVQGKIRRWVYFSQGKILMFDIDRNRWCDNIGRPHKSNHIIMVADMKQGVYYQKCHDPECKRINYKSQEKAIPEEINPFLQEKDFLDSGIWESEQLDDDILCQAATDLENNEAEQQIGKQVNAENKENCTEDQRSHTKSKENNNEREVPQKESKETFSEKKVSQNKCNKNVKDKQDPLNDNGTDNDTEFALFLPEDDDWEPWKDLPTCDKYSRSNTNAMS